MVKLWFEVNCDFILKINDLDHSLSKYNIIHKQKQKNRQKIYFYFFIH